MFRYNNKMFGSFDKPFVAAAKCWVAATKNLFVVPNFVAVTKPFFSVKAHANLNMSLKMVGFI